MGFYGRIAVISAFVLPALAQEPEVVIRADVRLVRLLVTVKNTAGQLVGSLDKSEFTIFDNGVRQEIAVFERTTEQPLSVALLMDASGSIAKDLKIATDAVRRFAQALFRDGNPADEVKLYSFNYEVQERTGFTRNLNAITGHLGSIKAEAGTSVYDAIHYAARSLEKRNGRHVIVIVTDGGDTTSHYKYHDALEAAHQADAPIYPILLMPITNDPGRNIGGENALTTLSQSTGGRMFMPSPGKELDQAFTDILHDLRTQYLVGFYPKNVPKAKDRFHRVLVQLPRPDLRVITRSGYYGEADRPE